MHCAACGTLWQSKTQRFCSSCGAAVSHDSGLPGAVAKGKYITCLPYPFEPFGRNGRAWWVICAATFLLVRVALSRDWEYVAVTAGAVLLPAALYVLNHAALSVFYDVRVYENGLDMDLPRSWSNTIFLPFDRICQYEWDGSMLRYQWGEEGPIILRKDLRPSSMPGFVFYFPRALRVPADQVPVVTSLLERASASHPSH